MNPPPDAPIDDPRAAPPAGAAKRAAILANEPATRTLLSLWLGEQGWQVSELDATQAPPHVVIAELAFPRTEPPTELRALARRFPGVPVVVISPTIVAGTPSRGDVARQLGVTAVLAMPLARAALLSTVEELTGPG